MYGNERRERAVAAVKTYFIIDIGLFNWGLEPYSADLKDTWGNMGNSGR